MQKMDKIFRYIRLGTTTALDTIPQITQQPDRDNPSVDHTREAFDEVADDNGYDAGSMEVGDGD